MTFTLIIWTMKSTITSSVTQSTGFFIRCSTNGNFLPVKAEKSHQFHITSVCLGCALTDRWCHREREVIHRQQHSEAEWRLSTRCSPAAVNLVITHYNLNANSYFQPWRCAERSDLMASYWSALLSNRSRSLASSLSPYRQSLFEKLLCTWG